MSLQGGTRRVIRLPWRTISTSVESHRSHRLLLQNASQIVVVGGGARAKLGAEMGVVDVLSNHSMLVDGSGKISRMVPAGAETDQLLLSLQKTGGVDRIVDCVGKCVLPGFVDGQTHAVFGRYGGHFLLQGGDFQR